MAMRVWERGSEGERGGVNVEVRERKIKRSPHRRSVPPPLSLSLLSLPPLSPPLSLPLPISLPTSLFLSLSLSLPPSPHLSLSPLSPSPSLLYPEKQNI